MHSEQIYYFKNLLLCHQIIIHIVSFMCLILTKFPDILKVFRCREEQMVGREHELIRGSLAELQLRVVWKSEVFWERCKDYFCGQFFFYDSPCLCNMLIYYYYFFHLLIDVCIRGAECLFMTLHNQGSIKESKAHQSFISLIT